MVKVSDLFCPDRDAKVSFGPDSGLFDLFLGVSLVSLSTLRGSYRTYHLVPVLFNRCSRPPWTSPLSIFLAGALL